MASRYSEVPFAPGILADELFVVSGYAQNYPLRKVDKFTEASSWVEQMDLSEPRYGHSLLMLDRIYAVSSPALTQKISLSFPWKRFAAALKSITERVFEKTSFSSQEESHRAHTHICVAAMVHDSHARLENLAFG